MVNIFNWIYTLLSRLLLSVLASGPIPKHVAFVMDGNRRFAKLRNRRVIEGHEQGFESLKNVLEVCLRLHIECVTIFVFSIENFSRPPEEVNGLMEMARGRFHELALQGQLLDRYSVRVNIIGNVSLLPEDVQKSVREMEELTRHNTRCILNVCMPYTSRDEITTSIRTTVASDVDPSLITPTLLTSNLPSNLLGSPPLDILIRTSGVKRLSDFLLWQCSQSTQIYFVQPFWPEFGMWEMSKILLSWQRGRWFGGQGSTREKEELEDEEVDEKSELLGR
ncbi:putative undecaprenyl diphosphate synthase-domain-containing protein [Mrakia frigida]|uniref:undecaprenyl diphosphate synthase family protein n=1 Tax=Mrakia frigida TaxID=29902 RepID=UPI003FCBFE8D